MSRTVEERLALLEEAVITLYATSEVSRAVRTGGRWADRATLAYAERLVAAITAIETDSTPVMEHAAIRHDLAANGEIIGGDK